MKILKKYSIVICIIAAVILLLLSFGSYLFSTLNTRTMLAQSACMLALLGIIIGFFKFDETDEK